MGWLYVPGLEDSSWEFPSSSPDIELWVTSSGTPMRRPLSWREWKRRPWIQLLFGTICRPSMANRGAARWISSLPDSHANRSQSPAKDSEPKTSVGSGQTSSASFGKFNPDGSFSKTSLSLFPEESGPSSVDWPNSGMMRGGMCSARRTAEPRTTDVGSSWSRNEYPTPTASAYGSSQNEGQIPHKRPTAGTPSLESWARGEWRTPQASDGEGGVMIPREGADPKLKLRDQGANWPTPMAADDGNKMTPQSKISGLLGAARTWPSPRSEDGESCGNHPGAQDSLTGITRDWPTPKARTGGPNSNRENRPEAGGPDLQEAAIDWPTPKVSDWKGADRAREENRSGDRHSGDGLATAAPNWPTPGARDWKDAGTVKPRSEGGTGAFEGRMDQLPRVATNWPTPTWKDGESSGSRTNPESNANPGTSLTDATCRSSHQGLRISSCGPNCSTEHRRLNPLFVEWLMGWPLGWTDFGTVGTELYLFRRHTLTWLLWRIGR